VIQAVLALLIYSLNTLPLADRIAFLGFLLAAFVTAFIVRRVLHQAWGTAILSAIAVFMALAWFMPMPSYTVTYYTYPAPH